MRSQIPLETGFLIKLIATNRDILRNRVSATRTRPYGARHNLIVLSGLPLANVRPSGLKARE
jgi:hypothetical protein